jgi:uncharacterized repeat protein (TIGR01451 family)
MLVYNHPVGGGAKEKGRGLKRIVLWGVVAMAMLLMLGPAASAQQTADVVPVVTKTANPDPAYVGAPLTFHITLDLNEGNYTAQAVQLSDILLPDMDLVSVTAKAADGSDVSADCFRDEPTPTTPDGAVGCRFGDVAGGGTVSMDVTVIPREAGTYQNWASSSFSLPAGVSVDPSRNGTSINVTVLPAPPAPPTPTTKEQCKKGGFATFGFADQGSCVSHVNGTAKKGT